MIYEQVARFAWITECYMCKAKEDLHLLRAVAWLETRKII